MLLEADKRLSQSLIWQIQRDYFLKTGMAAWQADVVPHEISCNPYIARSYGRLILAYLRDWLAAGLDVTEPIYVVELGAGSGRLTHHLLHYLAPILAEPPFASLPLRFILTDFAPANVAFWQAQPVLQRWVERGLLDFARFDGTAPGPLRLERSDLSLTPAGCRNPIILLANYFFDSIPMDSFAIADGQLCENLLTLESDRPEPNLQDETLWERLNFAYEAIPLEAEPYDNPLYNEILFEYEAVLPDTQLTFPNASLDCLHFWQQARSLLVLTADRGYTLLESLVDQPAPLPNLHGSFSMMVNYHAIARYTQLAGGMALHPPHYQDNLQLLALLLGALPGPATETARAFADSISAQGPDDYFALKQFVSSRYEQMTLPELLSWLRLSGHDSAILRACAPSLQTRLADADPSWFPDVCQLLWHCYQQHLPLDEADQLDSLIEDLLATMGLPFTLPEFADEMTGGG